MGPGHNPRRHIRNGDAMKTAAIVLAAVVAAAQSTMADVTILPTSEPATQAATKPPATRPSIEAIRKAAENGDATAQCGLGSCYLNGDGVPKDQAEAVKWFRKA